MPVWLFWDMLGVSSKSQVREKMSLYESAGLAFGSFQKEDSKAIRKEWEKTLKRGYQEAKKAPMTREQRRKKWERIAKKMF